MGEFQFDDFLPPKESRAGLDAYTRQAIGLFEELLPDLKKDPWPSRFAVISDRTEGDGRIVNLRLEKTFVARGRTAGTELPVTLSSETEKDKRVTQLGRRLNSAIAPINSMEELRAAFDSLESFKGIVVMPGTQPNPLLSDSFNFGLEPSDMRDLTTTPVPATEDGGGIKVTVRSKAFEIHMTREGGRWVVSKIAEAK
jgi:hypothetical protein